MKLGMISPSHDAQGIERVRGLGLGYAEFDVNGDDISYIDLPSVKKALADTGVRLGAVGRWGRNRILPDGGFDPKEQADEFRLIDLCRETGCPVYICGVNYVEGLSLYANYTAAIGYIGALMEYAGADVKICTYNCHWNSYLDTPGAWDVVHGHLKGLGIKFDPSHTVNGGRDYMDEAVRYGKLFYHVHLKGTVNVGGRRIDDPPAGLDMIDWGRLLSVLQCYGYDGMLSIEPHSSTWQGELGARGLRYTIDYFRALPFVTE